MAEEFTNGGFIPSKPSIVPPQTWRMIGRAEPSEEWIPLPAGRDRSLLLLQESARRMGFKLVKDNEDE